eukprot:1759122-Rhodomonas_salina.2
MMLRLPVGGSMCEMMVSRVVQHAKLARESSLWPLTRLQRPPTKFSWSTLRELRLLGLWLGFEITALGLAAA